MTNVIGWASVPGHGLPATTGGSHGLQMTATTLEELQSIVTGPEPRTILIDGRLQPGVISVGSNKTLVGLPGTEIHGHLVFDRSENIILQGLKIVGFSMGGDWKLDPQCDPAIGCFSGHDAVTITNESHHIYIDHCDISDGTNKNLNIKHGSDLITIGWTKFSYSTPRHDCPQSTGPRATGPKGHRFSNLIGHSDDNANQDAGRLNVTMHHCWWSDNVLQRMPRVRFGKVHLFNNLYTSADCDYCIGLGTNANILAENNAFIGVTNPINTNSYSNGHSRLRLKDNLFLQTRGTAPPERNPHKTFNPAAYYDYFPESASQVEVSVRSELTR